MPVSTDFLRRRAQQMGLSPFDLAMQMGLASPLATVGPKLGMAGGKAVTKAAGKVAEEVAPKAEETLKEALSWAGPVIKPEIQQFLRIFNDFKRLGTSPHGLDLQGVLKMLAERRGDKTINDPRLISLMRRVNGNLTQQLEMAAGDASKAKAAQQAATPASPFTTQAAPKVLKPGESFLQKAATPPETFAPTPPTAGTIAPSSPGAPSEEDLAAMMADMDNLINKRKK